MAIGEEFNFLHISLSVSPNDASFIKSGTIFTLANKWVISTKSWIINIGVAPSVYSCCKICKTPATLPSNSFSYSANVCCLSAKPNIFFTVAAAILPFPKTMAWSNIESPSRADPSAARATIFNASSSASIFSAVKTLWKSLTKVSILIRCKSKRWQRDKIVTGTLRISVVAKINITWAGGSSRVFNKALNALLESIWTSSII